MKYFDVNEFDCTHTGNNEMTIEFLEAIDLLRDNCGFPFVITSGYRDITHPAERHKTSGGTHTKGIAADIKVHNGAQRYTIVEEALKLGFTGIGVANSFVHVDTRTTQPVIWTYS